MAPPADARRRRASRSEEEERAEIWICSTRHIFLTLRLCQLELPCSFSFVLQFRPSLCSSRENPRDV